MSSSRKVPITFTFHRRDAHPPLFVAGSFSNPPWQPQEMDASIDQHGDYIFTKQVMVDECSEIQYKFRHASGDWWALDPDADTVTDDHGNVNSLLYSPAINTSQEITPLQEIHATKTGDTTTGHNDAETFVVTANVRNPDTDPEDPVFPKEVADNEELRCPSSTSIEETTNTATEVAESSFQLDEDEFGVDSGDMLPMFSHECFASPSSCREPGQQHENIDYSPESVDILSMSFDDPRLEHFPSDCDSIMATMRRVSTTIEADPTMVDEVALPPIITASPSIASNPCQIRGPFGVDDTNTAHEQTEDMNRRRASIPPRNSLESIVEGEEAPNGDEAQDIPTLVQYIGPIEERNLSLESSDSSNEDEGVAMSTTPRKRISEAARMKTTDDKAQPTTIVHEAATNYALLAEERTSIVSRFSKSSEQNDQPGLQKPTNGERSHSPSTTSPIHNSKKGDWIRTLLRTVFVDWISDLFCWLCSRSRNEV